MAGTLLHVSASSRLLVALLALLPLWTAAQSPTWGWSFELDSSDPENFHDVEIDKADGAIYAIGDAENTGIQIGPISLLDQDQGMLIKFNRDGTINWYVPIGGSDQETAESVTVAPNGNVYITGAFEGNCYFYNEGSATQAGSVTSFSGSKDIYIAAYSANGRFLWATQLGNGNDELTPSISSDEGGITVIGSYRGTLSYSGANSATALATNNYDLFLLRLDLAGGLQWMHTGGSSADDVAGVPVVSDGRIFVSQFASGSVIRWYNSSSALLGSSSASVFDHHITAFRTDGSWAWAQVLQDPGNSAYGYPNLAVGCEGLYVTGAIGVNTTFPDGSQIAGGSGTDLFYVCRFKRDTGAMEWVRTGTTSNATSHFNGRDISIGRYGAVYIGGTFEGTVSYGASSMTAVNGMEVFAMVLTPTGGLMSLQPITSNGMQYLSGIAADDRGGLAIAGTFRNAIDIPGHGQTGPSSNDNGFVAYAQYGNRIPECLLPSRFVAPAVACPNTTIDLTTWMVNPTNGVGMALSSAATSTTNATSALGQTNNVAATLSNGTSIVSIDLTNTVPAGEAIELIWRKEPGASGSTTLQAYTSVDNSTWTAAGPISTSRTGYIYTKVICTAAARYIRLAHAAGSAPAEVDALSYCFGTLSGGTWSGTGVSGTSWNTAGLTGNVAITYTTGFAPCENVTTRNVAIDNVPPAITCPANVVVGAPANTCSAVVNYAGPTVTDNCDASPILTWSHPPGSTFPVGTTTVTISASDGMQTSSCSFTVRVNDVTAPTLTCPTNISVNAAPGACSALATYSATATDNCTGPVTYIWSHAPGSLFPVGATTVTVRASDGTNISQPCSFTVTIVDDQPPVVVCPADITVNAAPGACSAAVTFGAAATDNCAATPVLTWSHAPGSNFPVGTTMVSVSASDGANTSAPCFFNVRVVDDQAPVIICPSNITVNADPDACFTAVAFSASVTDNCAASPVLTWSHAPGSVFPVGTTTVSVNASDGANSASCSFTVTVVDSQRPNVVCKNDSVVLNAGIATIWPLHIDGGSTDNCGITARHVSPNTLTTTGAHTVWLIVEDAAGNRDSCAATVTVVESICTEDEYYLEGLGSDAGVPVGFLRNTPPTAPSLINFDPSRGGDPGLTIKKGGSGVGESDSDEFQLWRLPSSSGSIDGPVVFTVWTAMRDMDMDKSGRVTAYLIRCDAAGGSRTMLAQATISRPDWDVANTGGWIPETFDFGYATSTINAAQRLGVMLVVPTSSDDDMWFAYDALQYPASVRIVSDADPEITCPPDLTVNTDPGVCTGIVTYALPLFTDNCPGAVLGMTTGLAPGAVFPMGTVENTYEVTDALGNTASCTFQVTVIDSEPPSVTCPADIVIAAPAGQCAAIVNYSATATDNCAGTPVLSWSHAPGSSFPVGTTTVSVSASDGTNASAPCSFTVTVLDEEEPQFVDPPSAQTFYSTAAACSHLYLLPTITSTDNCDADTQNGHRTFLQEDGSASWQDVTGTASQPLAPGVHSFEEVHRDESGNRDTCRWEVTVIDTIKPIITVPLSISVPAEPGACGATVSFTVASTDNCGILTATTDHSSGDLFPVGTTTVQANATDINGNAHNGASFTVTVYDDQAPVLACPTNITVNAAPGVCNAQVTFGASATDNCGGMPALTWSHAPGSMFPVGTTTVTVSASDGTNASAPCSFTVTVVDDQAPVLVCPANITVNAGLGACSAQVTFDASVTDNCGGTPALTWSQASGSLFPVGTTTVSLNASDGTNASAPCSFTITVVDAEAPVLACPTDITLNATPGTCSAAVAFNASATDNCGGTPALTWSHASGSMFPVGTTTVTVSASDGTNASAPCSFTITVVDAEAPILTCPADITVGTAPGTCSAAVTFDAPATDNCAVSPMLMWSHAPGSVFPVGTTTVTVSASDGTHSVSCSFNVTVTDNQAPFLTCPSPIVANTDAGACTAIVSYSATVTDNCVANPAFIWSHPPGSAFPIGTTTVTASAIDGANTSAPCSFTVTVVDAEAPVPACPTDITVTALPGACSAVATFSASATDNCAGTPALTWSHASGSSFPIGTTTVTVSASDGTNTSAPCSFIVTVEPPDAPWLSYTTTQACVTSSTALLPDNFGPVVAGAYFYSPDLPVAALNTNTGAITPSLAGAGTFTVHYKIPGTPAICTQLSPAVTIVIDLEPFAGNDIVETLCNEIDPIDLFSLLGTADVTGSWNPALAGGHLGTFDPSTQTAGTYTYMLPGVGTCSSDNASVTITLVGPGDPGEDGALSICSTDLPVDLLTVLGGTPDAGGTWSGPSILTGSTYDPASMQPGTYAYTVSNAPCNGVIAYVEVSIVTANLWYADTDGDSFGDPDVVIEACAQPGGHVANNTDLCPTDPLKTAPGACGCGVVDTDNDGDGNPDCTDPCDNNTDGDACDDGNANTANDVLTNCTCAGLSDADGDGTPDVSDPCDNTTDGDPCDDGNANTADDVLTDCTCAGQPDADGDGTPDVSDPCDNSTDGDACDDGNANTANDTLANCTCAGLPDLDGDGTPDVDDPCDNSTDGDACDDGNASTVNDVLTNCACAGQLDSDGDGTPDVDDPCDNATDGDPCDDGNANTANDALTNCTCAGLPDLDGDGTPDVDDPCDNSTDGDACNDGNAGTVNDVLTNCVCAGQPDSDGDGTPDAIDLCDNTTDGDPCNDGNANTANDVLTNCTCAGLSDLDGDGTPDVDDPCDNSTDGDACDDGNAATVNDVLTNCVCAGQPDSDEDGIPDVNDPCDNNTDGDPCNDANANTVNDVLTNCTCAGQPDSDGDGIPDVSDPCDNNTDGDACDDGNASTINDVLANCVCAGQLDSDGDGDPDVTDSCPTVFGGVGSPCDDGQSNTIDDTIGSDCTCTGTLVIYDCLGVANGTALPGTSCNDNNATTGNDTWSANCQCAGLPLDCAGVPGGTSLPGTSCDDGDDWTSGDTWTVECTCTGTPVTCTSDAGDDQSICGTTTTLQATGEGLWSGAPELEFAVPGDAASTVLATAPGMYEAYWTVTNGPCVASDTVLLTFTELADPAFSYAQSTYCTSDMPPSPWTANAGGTFISTDGLVIDAATGVIDLETSTPGEHVITHAFGGDCPSSTAITVTIATEADASWTPPGTLCSNGSPIALSALVTGTAGGTWSGAGVTGSTFHPNGASGSFPVTYTAALGACTASTTHTITVNNAPTADAGNDAAVCGFEQQLHAVPSTANGIWTSTPTLQFTPSASAYDATITTTVPGSYLLIWTVNDGTCSDADTVTAVFHDPAIGLWTDAGADQELEVLTSATLQGRASAGAALSWTVLTGTGSFTAPHDSTTVVAGLSIGTNAFMLTATLGQCASVADTVMVLVDDLFIPQGFSPNGDGYNDRFEVTGMEAFPNSEFLVFNRWGQEVYRNGDYANEWEGTSPNGGALPDDTYFYVLNLTGDRTYNGYLIIRR